MNRFIWPLIVIMYLSAYSHASDEENLSPMKVVINPLLDLCWPRERKVGNWRNFVHWQDNLDLFYQPFSSYDMLDRESVERAMAPIERLDKKDGSSISGPLCGYRAILCMNEPTFDFDEFAKECPTPRARRGVNPVGALCGCVTGAGSAILGTVLTLVTHTFYPLIPALGVCGVGTIAGCYSACRPVPIGPDPEQLASHLNSKKQIIKTMKERAAHYTGYTHYEPEISLTWQAQFARNIQDRGVPMIVLLVAGVVELEYITIIGVAPPGESPSYNWVILDKDGKVGVIDSQSLEFWMNSAEYASEMNAHFHALLFAPRSKDDIETDISEYLIALRRWEVSQKLRHDGI